MKKHFFTAVMAAILVAGGISAAGAYEATDVKGGATVRGVAKVSGKTPQDEKVEITKNQEVCGKTQMRGKYVINDAKVKNAVVWLSVEKGKPLTSGPVNVTVKNCMAEPHVSVGTVGGKFVFRNDDDVMHTVQLKLGLEYQSKVSGRPVKDGATIYNLAMPNKGVSIEKPIKAYHRYTKDTGFIQIKSNTDECMGGYIFVFDHPYAAVTDEQGSFSLDNVPPGTYTMTIWHEGFAKQEQQVTVSAGEKKNVEFELK